MSNNQYSTPDHRDIHLDFLKPVALTTSGIIIRGHEPGHTKYMIIWSTTGAQQQLGKETCDKIDIYLKRNKLPDELFTL